MYLSLEHPVFNLKHLAGLRKGILPQTFQGEAVFTFNVGLLLRLKKKHKNRTKYLQHDLCFNNLLYEMLKG